MTRSPLHRLLCAATCLTIVSACSVTDEMYADITGNDTISFECPGVQIIEDGQEVTVFRPGLGRDIIDIAFEAKFSAVTAECEYDENDQEMTLIVQYTIEANRGPAAETATVDLPYFVAIVERDNQRVLARQGFDTTATFQAGKRRVRFIEEIEQTLTVRNTQDGGRYDVLASFQLTPEQLKYNRAKLLR